MRILGISGRDIDAAVALAVNGRIVAAVSEEVFARVRGVGYTHTGGFPARAAAACVAAAGCRLEDIDEFAVVTDGAAAPLPIPSNGRAVVRPVDALQADAIQASASACRDAVLICGTRPEAFAAFVRKGEHLQAAGDRVRGDRLWSFARTFARALGVDDGDPYPALDRLSVGGDPSYLDELTSTMQWTRAEGPAVDQERAQALLEGVGNSLPHGLSNAASPNVRVQAARRDLAASFACQLAVVVRDAARALCGGHDPATVAFGGSLLGNPRTTTELRRLVGGELQVAAVPERTGRALGAALAGTMAVPDRLSGLALGPGFTDDDIKRTLDNCRLDYIYEPDWRRLFDRTSKMLSQGKVIAWFQGAMTFGPRAIGTRSILCDPSSRYARHNMNEYLRQVPVDEPLPITIAPAARDAVTGSGGMPRVVVDMPIRPEWKEKLTAALDWRGHVRIQPLGSDEAAELRALLDRHYERTGVPALIETNLCGSGEPVACTPRDALRIVYSSAIDALVIGRFVLMKDHWLLRSQSD